MAGAQREERQQIVGCQTVEYLADCLEEAGSAQGAEEAQLLEQQRRGWAAAMREVLLWATRLKWCPRRLTPARGPSEHPCEALRRRCPCRNLHRTL